MGTRSPDVANVVVAPAASSSFSSEAPNNNHHNNNHTNCAQGIHRMVSNNNSNDDDRPNSKGGNRRFSELLRPPPSMGFPRPPSPFAREAEGTGELRISDRREDGSDQSDQSDQKQQQQQQQRRMMMDAQHSLGSDGTLSRSLSSPELLQLPALLLANNCCSSAGTTSPSPLPTNDDLLQPLLITSAAIANSLLLFPPKSAASMSNHSGLSSASSLQSLKAAARQAHQQQILRPKMQLNGSSILSIDMGRMAQQPQPQTTLSCGGGGANCGVAASGTRQRHSSGGSAQSDAARRNLISLTTSVGNALQRTKRELQRTRLSHAFYICILPIYTVAGALLFQALDGTHDDQQRALYEQRCQGGRAARMADLETFCNGTQGVQCFERMHAFLAEVEQCYRRWHEVNRTTTHPMSDLTNAIIYAFSVYTTIGYGTISASSMSARIATVFYGMLGIPLFFAFIKEEGNMFRTMFIWLYNRIKVRWRRRMAMARLPTPLRKLSSTFRTPPPMGFKRRSTDAGTADDEVSPLSATNAVVDAEQSNNNNNAAAPAATRLRFAKNAKPPPPPYMRQCSDMSLPMGWKGAGGRVGSTSGSSGSGKRPVALGSVTAGAAGRHRVSSECSSAVEQRRVFLCGVLVFLIYLLAVSALFALMTGWDFFTSFYFLFNSVALIGFGDVFPSQSGIILANMFFIVLGVILFSMCYFILQEEIRIKAFEASRKARMSITKYSQSLMLHTRPWSRRNSPAFDKNSEEGGGGAGGSGNPQFDRLRKRRQSAPAITVELPSNSDNNSNSRRSHSRDRSSNRNSKSPSPPMRV